MQAVDNNTEKIRIHRVGTFTAGIILVAAGILFILHMFIPVISYTLIFQLWPCVLILLGAEILSEGRMNPERFVYDTGAVIILVILLCFSCCMAGAEMVMKLSPLYFR